MKKFIIHPLSAILVLLLCGCAAFPPSAPAWPVVVFNPTNGVVLIPTNFVAANLAGVSVTNTFSGTATNLSGNALVQVTNTALALRLTTATNISGGALTQTTNISLSVAQSVAATNLPPTSPNNYFVYTNGNDATARVADESHPWATLASAVASVVPPAMIKIGVGTFNVSNLTLPNNTVLEGINPSLTKLLIVGSSGLATASNSVVRNATFFSTNQNAAQTYLLRPYGWNIRIENCSFIGSSDNIAINGPSGAGTNGLIQNCSFQSGWDCINLFNAVGWVIKNNTFTLKSTLLDWTNNLRAITLNGAGSCSVLNNTFAITNSTGNSFYNAAIAITSSGNYPVLVCSGNTLLSSNAYSATNTFAIYDLDTLATITSDSYWVSAFNCLFNSRNVVISDNYFPALPSTPSVTGSNVYFWNSNRVIYGVSATKTNLLLDLR